MMFEFGIMEHEKVGSAVTSWCSFQQLSYLCINITKYIFVFYSSSLRLAKNEKNYI